MPKLNWRLQSSFPKSLDTIHGAGVVFANAVREMTDGRFNIQVFAPGDIVGGLQVADAVSDGTVEAGHTASYYYWGKDPTFAFGTAVPFGLNARMQNAWMYQGGGIESDEQVLYALQHYWLSRVATRARRWAVGFAKRSIPLPTGRVLKSASADLVAQSCRNLAVSRSKFQVATFIRHLEKGTIDAAEWVGPYDDEKLGFQRVAKYYYYPGWWEGQAMLHFFFNLETFDALPKAYKSIVRSATKVANQAMMTRYDMLNPGSIRRLVGRGAVLRPFSEQVLDSCFNASNAVYSEITAENETFKKVYEAMKEVRAQNYLWFQISEHTSDTYMMILQRKKLL